MVICSIYNDYLVAHCNVRKWVKIEKKVPFQMCLLLLALLPLFPRFFAYLYCYFSVSSLYTAGWSMISSLINHKFFTQTKTFIILFICFRFPSTTPNFIQWAYSPWDRISPYWTCHRKFPFWSFHDSRSKRHIYHDISQFVGSGFFEQNSSKLFISCCHINNRKFSKWKNKIEKFRQIRGHSLRWNNHHYGIIIHCQIDKQNMFYNCIFFFWKVISRNF